MKIGLVYKSESNVKDMEYSVSCDREVVEIILHEIMRQIEGAAEVGQIETILGLAESYRDLKEVLDGNNE